MTVLIVESEAIVRLELAAQLKDIGLVVLEAADADEALGLFDAHAEIRLLFTDIRMPGSMDGLRLAHRVRDRWPPIRVIVVSGELDTRPWQLPDNSVFLAKPYRPEWLSDAVFPYGRPKPHTPGWSTRTGV